MRGKIYFQHYPAKIGPGEWSAKVYAGHNPISVFGTTRETARANLMEILDEAQFAAYEGEEEEEK